MKFFLTFACILIKIYCFAQPITNTATNTPTYPKPVAYFSVVHPLATIDKNETVYNFSNGVYTVGFPFGINVLTSNTTGYSLEIVPFIRSANGSSKTSNVLFHPGFMFRRPHGFTIITRAAFETGGRYGTTLVFNKIIAKIKTNNFFISTPIPIRFGNDRPASIGINIQLGVTF
ncbi:MAG: hypothetical protein H7101_03000 [Deinococcales bacterium]|nr:hypothetical protein [Chitinophagaceae bacterium]